MKLVIPAPPGSFVLLAGLSILMILFTARSLSEEQGGFWKGIQLLLSGILCIYSGEYLFCLLFTEYRSSKRQWLRFFLPAISYLTILFFTDILRYIQGYALSEMPAEKLLHLLILMALSGVLYALEKIVSSYITAREQTTRAVTVAAVNEMYEKKLNQELAFKNYLAEKNARFQERETISRNIHNSVGHSIMAAIMTLEAADMLFESNPDEAREKMNIAAGRIRESLASIRRAVRVLDTENEWIDWEDFINNLMEISERFTMDYSTTDTQIRVRNDFGDTAEEQLLPREHTEFLTGAFKELLTNGVKHGNADNFIVHLNADSAHVKLSVLDNGKSDFNETNLQERLAKGFGLKKLVSYAKHCGGTTVFSNENGFLAEISLPLQQESQ